MISAPRRIAFVGNALPRRCGIATFTTDLQAAVAAGNRDVRTAVVAMNDHGQTYDYPPVVAHRIRDDIVADYVRAAEALNADGTDLVCLQHEFGIFGGEAGGHVLAFLSRLRMPVVTTLHTVLADPPPAHKAVLQAVVDASTRVVVMARMARDLLLEVYGVPASKIDVIAHGIPDRAFAEPDADKATLGFAGRPVVLTFGLLSPNKGIEVMIDAMPSILAAAPDTVYVVLGATHPNLVRHEGEAYRERLQARTRDRGVQDNVVFLDRFVDLPTLLSFIGMCDVYATPYLSEAQMTSGTLAYSFGLGKAVVSTPYWHARELLADGRGVLVPFGDAVAIGREIADLLRDTPRRDAMRRRAHADGRSMVWARVAEAHMNVFAVARRDHRIARTAGTATARMLGGEGAPPDLRTDHLLVMCDDTGLFQHAIHDLPDRSHGYCVDDNARALLLSCALGTGGEVPLPETLTARFAAFLQHAWNPDVGRFRNFMGFDRRWLDDAGSEDSHGRALWALGTCARDDRSPSRRRWAAELFALALPAALAFGSPRAQAFVLLGLDGHCAAVPGDEASWRARDRLADALSCRLSAGSTADRVWFEAGLSYDNARLPQALIVSGVATGSATTVARGLGSLAWLNDAQTGPAGQFRPAGSEGFLDVGRPPRAFDQQPLDATATVAANLAAFAVDRDPRWIAAATAAYAWFHGANDLSADLADLGTGACRDGLHRDRPNENRGGESLVSYLGATADVRRFAQAAAADRGRAFRPLAVPA